MSWQSQHLLGVSNVSNEQLTPSCKTCAVEAMFIMQWMYMDSCDVQCHDVSFTWCVKI